MAHTSKQLSRRRCCCSSRRKNKKGKKNRFFRCNERTDGRTNKRMGRKYNQKHKRVYTYIVFFIKRQIRKNDSSENDYVWHCNAGLHPPGHGCRDISGADIYSRNFDLQLFTLHVSRQTFDCFSWWMAGNMSTFLSVCLFFSTFVTGWLMCVAAMTKLALNTTGWLII